MNGAGSVAVGLRIGELSRRVGLSVDVLRAWERRYGVLRPERTRSGQRVYAPDDEARVRRMQAHIAAGYSPQMAARMTLDTAGGTTAPDVRPPGPGSDRAGALLERLLAFDEPGAQAELDALLAAYSLDAVLREVVLPLLRRVGEGWERGTITVAQEHFASNLLGGRLRALARGLDRGTGPRALLACVPGELHDLGALTFALALRGRGWRVTWLGADVPLPALVDTVERLRPDLVVLVAARQEPLARVDAAPLAPLAAEGRLAIGGAGAREPAARRLGARLLRDDAVAAADELALS